jgi:hypothetical protein
MNATAEIIEAPLLRPLAMHDQIKIDTGTSGVTNHIMCLCPNEQYRDGILRGGAEASRLLIHALPHLHEGDRIELRVAGINTTDAIILRDHRAKPALSLRFAIVAVTDTSMAPLLEMPVGEIYEPWFDGARWCVVRNGQIRHNHFLHRESANACCGQLNAASPMVTMSGR